MSHLARLVVTAGLLAAGLWAAFYWVEADKEIRILCQQMRPTMEMERVRGTLETALYMHWRLILDEDGDRLLMESRRNLGTSTCVVPLEDDAVASAAIYDGSPDVSRWAVWVAASLFAALALFQVALAAGAPLGAFAWGGRHRRLPPRLRRASAGSAVVLGAGLAVVLESLGVFTFLGLAAVEIALWVLALVFGLSALANSASESAPERRTGTPVAFVLCIACFLVVLGL